MKNDQVFLTRINLHTRRKLDALAKKTQRSRSEVVRILIEHGDRVLSAPLAIPEEDKESTEVRGGKHD